MSGIQLGELGLSAADMELQWAGVGRVCAVYAVLAVLALFSLTLRNSRPVLAVVQATQLQLAAHSNPVCRAVHQLSLWSVTFAFASKRKMLISC